jgi:hypothetical protein
MNKLPFCDLVLQFTSIARNGHFMTTRDSSGVRIDSVHSGAICTEIGERLRVSLAMANQRWPSDLHKLTERLDTVERGDGRLSTRSKFDPR